MRFYDDPSQKRRTCRPRRSLTLSLENPYGLEATTDSIPTEFPCPWSTADMRPTTSTGPDSERDRILTLLAETIETVERQIDPDGAESLDEEKIQIQWVRALGHLSGQYRMLMRDGDIDEMQGDLELLKLAIDGDRR